MSESRRHAVVLGAGMAGLLAARVLSEFYATVTVVERDRLPASPQQRRGVPQGRHLHALSSRGAQVLEELFPGFLDELVAGGAEVLDDGDLSRIYTRFGRYGLNRSGTLKDPAALAVYLASRPFLEFHVRRRVAALGGVRLLDDHDVLTAVAIADRVTGVRVASRATSEQTTLEADLVVDAMGRATRTPALLEQLGYLRPAEDCVAAHGTYYSQFLRIPDGGIDEKLMLVRPGHGVPIGGLLAYENHTWVLTVGQLAMDPDPPTHLAGMLALAEQFAPPRVLAGLRAAEPLGEVAVSRLPTGVWRRYDQLPWFPAGLLVIGDALCTFDPIYGQGMAMAALQAVALRDHLRNRTTPAHFFRAAAARIGPVWAMNKDTDRILSPARTRPSISRRLQRWAMDQVLKAAEHDVVLTERFLRVTHLVDPPGRRQDPSLLVRALVGNLRRRWPIMPSRRESPATRRRRGAFASVRGTFRAGRSARSTSSPPPAADRPAGPSCRRDREAAGPCP